MFKLNCGRETFEDKMFESKWNMVFQLDDVLRPAYLIGLLDDKVPSYQKLWQNSEKPLRTQ